MDRQLHWTLQLRPLHTVPLGGRCRLLVSLNYALLPSLLCRLVSVLGAFQHFRLLTIAEYMVGTIGVRVGFHCGQLCRLSPSLGCGWSVQVFQPN
jgi:hypothetical protein